MKPRDAAMIQQRLRMAAALLSLAGQETGLKRHSCHFSAIELMIESARRLLRSLSNGDQSASTSLTVYCQSKQFDHAVLQRQAETEAWIDKLVALEAGMDVGAAQWAEDARNAEAESLLIATSAAAQPRHWSDWSTAELTPLLAAMQQDIAEIIELQSEY